jgi:hypothetical protein
MEILTSFLARVIFTPGSLVLLEIIIRADFLMILFLIPTSVFLIFDTIDKTRTEAHFGRLYALWTIKTWSITNFLTILMSLFAKKIGLRAHNFVCSRARY